MRSPCQGGLPPVDTAAGTAVEVACDESGFFGTNLLDHATPLITRASVDLRAAEADTLIAALRRELRLSAREVKSGRLLRSPQAGQALQPLLTASVGPGTRTPDRQGVSSSSLASWICSSPNPPTPRVPA